MKSITIRMLKKMSACSDAVEWVEEQGTSTPKELFGLAIKAERFGDINWILTKLMNKKQCVMYAIYAAEKVLHFYEDKYSDDNRPRRAIEAAKAYLVDPCTRTKDAAGDAAAARAAAAGAAAAAAAAGDAAAAWAARAAAAWAARAAAAWAARAAAAGDARAAAAGDAMYTNILNYGFSLLDGK